MSAERSPSKLGHDVVIPGRRQWTELSDEQLLAQCSIDTYRASGPGGQKRNKTSSAVRLRHHPSGLIVIAEESRSQHENKAKALRRLRQSLYLHCRETLPPESEGETLQGAILWRRAGLEPGQMPRSVKHPAFWPMVGLALDVLLAVQGRVSEAADILGLSTAQLVHFFQLEPKVWQQVNRMRQLFGHPPLR
jgi:hypothetical protein